MARSSPRTAEQDRGFAPVRRQVAAIPTHLGEDGTIWVMLITSRETRRWIMPKGWPMKGKKDYAAAAEEARQEAGVVGRVRKKPIGHYAYWKRGPSSYIPCYVTLYVMAAQRQLEFWPEKGQREFRWFTAEEAADRVDEPGLRKVLLSLTAADLSW
jgi:8-oxo-dGTP pyrophosphatase MutT (NUDIX family)